MAPRRPPSTPLFNDDKPFVVSKGNIALTWPAVASICALLLLGSWQMWDIRQSVRDANRDRWTKSNQREYANSMQYQNPTLKVPNIDDIANRMDRP